MKVLKPITVDAIYEAQPDKDCADFRREFGDFLLWCFKNVVFPQDNLTLNSIETQFPAHPEWKKFLIDHGFIGEEVTYTTGHQLRWGNDTYVLTTYRGQAAFINRDTGNTKAGWHKVKYVDNITPSEFDNIKGF